MLTQVEDKNLDETYSISDSLTHTELAWAAGAAFIIWFFSAALGRGEVGIFLYILGIVLAIRSFQKNPNITLAGIFNLQDFDDTDLYEEREYNGRIIRERNCNNSASR